MRKLCCHRLMLMLQLSMIHRLLRALVLHEALLLLL